MGNKSQPVIVAGECEHHAWCATCGAPSRVRLALHDGSPEGLLLAVVEVCPGCGGNHATPMVKVTPADPPGLLARLGRKPVPQEALCAWADCTRRAKPGCAVKLEGSDGDWTYLFCKPAHRAAWAEVNRIVLR